MGSTHEDRFIQVLNTTPEVKKEEPLKEEPRKPARFSPRNAFEHHNAHPLVLDALLIRAFGPNWLEWEPETIWSEIQDTFKQQISVHNRNKIQAVKLCHLLDTPWEAWEVFVTTCQALNNNVPNFRILQKPTIAQVMCATDIMDKIRDEKFSEEVLKFIAACFLDEGTVYLPPPVDEAQKWATGAKYSCSNCGRVDRDDGDGFCDGCGSSKIQVKIEENLNWKPIKARFEQCLKMGDDRPELQETATDVQTARLLVAHNYVLERRKQLREQIAVTKHVRSYL